MAKRDIFMRGIEEEVFLEFKAEAVKRKIKLGEALTEAMKLWLQKQEK